MTRPTRYAVYRGYDNTMGLMRPGPFAAFEAELAPVAFPISNKNWVLLQHAVVRYPVGAELVFLFKGLLALTNAIQEQTRGQDGFTVEHREQKKVTAFLAKRDYAHSGFDPTIYYPPGAEPEQLDF